MIYAKVINLYHESMYRFNLKYQLKTLFFLIHLQLQLEEHIVALS